MIAGTAAVLILGYLTGSIPTAVWAGKLIIRDDIRNHGSGNAGATNVFRVMGWKPALLVMIIDIGKGMLSVLLWPCLFHAYPDLLTVQILAGSAAVLGHIWTVFAGFRGGKGVGTAFGVLLALAPLASAATLIVWIALVAAFRIVSIGSLAAGIVFPLALTAQRHWLDPDLPQTLIWTGVVLGVLIFFTHRRNIVRLLQGKENRFGKEKQ